MSARHDSFSSPIRVDFVPEELVGPGRLGMTFAPGKIQDGMTARWERDLEVDLRRLREELAIDVLVSLLEPWEFEDLRIPLLLDRAMAHGLEPIHHPIPDGGVPADLASFRAVLGELLDRLAMGRSVAVHCRGGLGRSGLVAASCLVERGSRPDDAIAIVRSARPGAIEHRIQEDFVRRMRGL